MNLRDKFLWNLVIGICSLALLWNIWNLYDMNHGTNQKLLNFENEQVGTDKELEKKVSDLENTYVKRDAMKFVMADNPVDLNRVVSLDGSSSSKKRGNLWVSGIVNRINNDPMALISYKDKTYNVVEGDSIAGGVITKITSTEVIFEKNDKITPFNLGVNNNAK